LATSSYLGVSASVLCSAPCGALLSALWCFAQRLVVLCSAPCGALLSALWCFAQRLVVLCLAQVCFAQRLVVLCSAPCGTPQTQLLLLATHVPSYKPACCTKIHMLFEYTVVCTLALICTYIHTYTHECVLCPFLAGIWALKC